MLFIYIQFLSYNLGILLLTIDPPPPLNLPHLLERIHSSRRSLKTIAVTVISLSTFCCKNLAIQEYRFTYAWVSFTCNHAPSGHTTADLQLFSFLKVYFPSPGTKKETIPHPRAPDRPHIRFLLHLFDPYKSKTTRFDNFF